MLSNSRDFKLFVSFQCWNSSFSPVVSLTLTGSVWVRFFRSLQSLARGPMALPHHISAPDLLVTWGWEDEKATPHSDFQRIASIQKYDQVFKKTVPCQCLGNCFPTSMAWVTVTFLANEWSLQLWNGCIIFWLEQKRKFTFLFLALIFHGLIYFFLCERYCAMLSNTFLAMSLFLPVDIIKAAANFFPLPCIPVSLWGEVGVEAFPRSRGWCCAEHRSTPALHWSVSVGSAHIKQLFHQPDTCLLNISSGAKTKPVDQSSSHWVWWNVFHWFLMRCGWQAFLQRGPGSRLGEGETSMWFLLLT